MKKLLFSMIILIAVVIWIVSDSNEPVSYYTDYSVENINKQQCKMIASNYKDYSLIEVPLDGGIGDYFVTEEYVFYLVNQVIPMGNYAETCSLMRYSLKTKETDEVLRLQKDSSFFANELVYTGNHLAWQILYEDGRREFELLDLQTGELKIFYSSHASNSIAFSYSLDGYSNYVTWYEGREVDGDHFWKYMIYNVEENSIDTIDNVSVSSPYMNPNIRNGNIVTLHRLEDHFSLEKRNLLSGHKMTIHLPKEIVKMQNICANNEYIIWNTQHGDSSIYVYDITKKKLNLLSIMPDIFSIDLVYDEIIINDRKDLGLVAVDLDSYKVKQIGDNELNRGSFMGNEVFDDVYMAIYLRNDVESLRSTQGVFYIHMN